MINTQPSRENAPVRHFVKWLGAAVLSGVWVLTVSGCAPKERRTLVDHSSPESVFIDFCQALNEEDEERLIEACDPALRPTWRELLRWVDRHRRSDIQSSAVPDVLGGMRTRFCGNKSPSFERSQPDMVFVQWAAQSGPMILRKRSGKWYVGFEKDFEYTMKLATEIIKSELGKRPGGQGSVMEASGLSGG